jgi:hypothetical protein
LRVIELCCVWTKVVIYLFCLVKKGKTYKLYIVTDCIKHKRHFIYRITGSHASGYEEFCLLGYSAM